MNMPHRSLRESKTPATAAVSQRLEETIDSSEYWARRMPREAVRLVRKERLYGVAAGGVSLLTGLLAWPLLAESSMLTAQVLISGMSGLAALAIAAPYASGLTDRGEDSIKLGSAYGEMHRELVRGKEQIVEGFETNKSQLSGFYQQFDYIEEHRDSLGIRPIPSRVSAAGLPLAGEFGRREQTVPIAPRTHPRRSAPAAPAAPVGSGRTVVVDQDSVATLIYLVANHLASPSHASTAEFARRPSSFQPEFCEQGSAGRFEQHWQPALPFETSRGPDSGRREENRLSATPQSFLSKLSGLAGRL
ncbi:MULTISPECIES: hypothetical protein [unclassified Streptomyces]|uniref:hypothetical protein n=1 Tax=unclassified Streptomyces TaxID=2593676 RepID=UPI0036EF8CDF